MQWPHSRQKSLALDLDGKSSSATLPKSWKNILITLEVSKILSQITKMSLRIITLLYHKLCSHIIVFDIEILKYHRHHYHVTLAMNSGLPSIPLTSLKGKIHFGGQHKYILSKSTNTFSQARKYIHLTANNFFAHPQIYNSIAWPPSNDWQFSSSQDISTIDRYSLSESICEFFKLRINYIRSMCNCLPVLMEGPLNWGQHEISLPPKN